MPRRISDYPDAFAGWNLISSFGSIISVVATWLFLYIVYVQLVEGKATTRYPWLTPQFYSDSLQTLLNRSYNSLEWALNSPPKPHAFVSLPIQAAVCIHGIAGYCQACWNITNAHKIACTHHWVAFRHNNPSGVACDFGDPIHTITTYAQAFSCDICHAIVCAGCFAG
jgi:heme/copper-type cytochrome/quinol oxidase subunit 1